MTLPYRDAAPPNATLQRRSGPGPGRLCGDLALAALLCSAGALLLHWVGVIARYDALRWVRALP